MAKKITQTKIAQNAEISPTHLTLIMQGAKRPSWQTAKRLALVTDTDPVFWMDADPKEIRAKIKTMVNKNVR